MAIQIQTQNAGHAIPNYAPIAQGMQNFGQGLGSFFKQRRDEEKERKKRETMSRIFQSENPLQAATELGMGGSPDVLNSIFLRRKLQAGQGAAPRKIIKGKDGFNYYADDRTRVLPDVKVTPKDERTPQKKKYDEYVTDQKARGLPVLSLHEWSLSSVKAGVPQIPDATPKQKYWLTQMEEIEKIPEEQRTAAQNRMYNVARSELKLKPTEGEGRAGRVADVGTTALGTLSQTLPDGSTLFEKMSSLGNVAAERLPFGSGAFLQSEEYKLADQAAREVITQILRWETGAEAKDSETENLMRIYMPRPGDGADVMKQKWDALQGRVEAARKLAGPGATKAGQTAEMGKPVSVAPDGGGGIMGALQGAGEAVANLFTGGGDEVVPTAAEMPGMMRPPENPSIPPIMAAQAAQPAPEANPYHPMPPLQVNVPATPADKEATKKAFPDLDPAAQLKLVETMTPQDVQDMLPQINQASDAVRAAVKARLRSLLSTGK